MGKRKQWDQNAVKALKPGERYFAEGIGVRMREDESLSWWIAYRAPVAHGARGRKGTRVEQEQLVACRTKTQAEAILRDRKAKIFTGEYQPRVRAAEILFEEYVDTFVKLKATLSTVKKYESQLRRVFVPMWGKRSMRSIKTIEIITWYVERQKRGALATANRELAALKSFFSTAATPDSDGRRVVETSPAARIPVKKEDNARDTVLTDDQMATLAELARERNDYIRPFYFILDYQGPRMLEALSLRRADVIFTAGDEAISLVDHKSGERRWVPLHPYTVEALRWWFAVGGPGDIYVFPGRGRNGHMTKPYVEWRKFVAAAGMPWLTPHDLRHNFNSQMDRAGVGSATRGAFTGQKTEAIRRRYTHSQMEIMREAIGRIGAAAAPNVERLGKHRANTATPEDGLRPVSSGEKTR